MENKYTRIRLDDLKTFEVVALNSIEKFDPAKFDPNNNSRLFFKLVGTEQRVQVFEILELENNLRHDEKLAEMDKTGMKLVEEKHLEKKISREKKDEKLAESDETGMKIVEEKHLEKKISSEKKDEKLAESDETGMKIVEEKHLEKKISSEKKDEKLAESDEMKIKAIEEFLLKNGDNCKKNHSEAENERTNAKSVGNKKIETVCEGKMEIILSTVNQFQNQVMDMNAERTQENDEENVWKESFYELQKKSLSFCKEVIAICNSETANEEREKEKNQFSSKEKEKTLKASESASSCNDNESMLKKELPILQIT
ncbi:DNA ligase 1-like [Leptopilina boulardi]|uniref:DNA ligase 1-like n=1 Tax=Leptopilina boulardi TaxID=63433 RepID=UPI0021F5C637|nr:DNA ligase 1-like [Leptopilina boulardi]